MQWLSLIQSNLKTCPENVKAVRINATTVIFLHFVYGVNGSIFLEWKMNRMNAKATFTIPVY